MIDNYLPADNYIARGSTTDMRGAVISMPDVAIITCRLSADRTFRSITNGRLWRQAATRDGKQ